MVALTVTVPEYPDRTYSGVVEASSRSVDAASGTTRMQPAFSDASESATQAVTCSSGSRKK